MAPWTVRFDKRAFKEIRKLGKADQIRLRNFVDERLPKLDHPRQIGSALSGNLEGLWRYRVGDIRLICDVRDSQFVILVVSVGNRGSVYR